VIGVAIAEETRLVVRLAIDLFEADYPLVKIGGALVVANKEVSVTQTTRVEKSLRGHPVLPSFGLASARENPSFF
jgi:hypothetical protein